MSTILPGTPFHGEFTSADASALTEANSRFTLYGAGSAAAITLAAGDQVVITDLKVWSTGAITVTVYDGADATVAAGERIDLADYAAKTGLAQTWVTPFFCQKGTYPKVKGSGAGQVDCQIRGTIVRVTP